MMMGRANSRMEETPKMYRQTIVTSVKTLIETDAVTNAATAVTLLRSIETLL